MWFVLGGGIGSCEGAIEISEDGSSIGGSATVYVS